MTRDELLTALSNLLPFSLRKNRRTWPWDHRRSASTVAARGAGEMSLAVRQTLALREWGIARYGMMIDSDCGANCGAH